MYLKSLSDDICVCISVNDHLKGSQKTAGLKEFRYAILFHFFFIFSRIFRRNG